MASHTDDGDGPTRRYADFELCDGQVVIYDTENSDAWIESSVGIDLAALQNHLAE